MPFHIKFKHKFKDDVVPFAQNLVWSNMKRNSKLWKGRQIMCILSANEAWVNLSYCATTDVLMNQSLTEDGFCAAKQQASELNVRLHRWGDCFCLPDLGRVSAELVGMLTCYWYRLADLQFSVTPSVYRSLWCAVPTLRKNWPPTSSCHRYDSLLVDRKRLA